MSTNNKRKRAPGGGRKPKGPFTGNTERFNVRCTPAIKDKLEIEASNNKRSLPQEIQARLQHTLDDDADKSRDPAAAALLWMVEYTAGQFRRGMGDLPAWRTDPGEFEGFKAALNRVLERLRPPGDAEKALARTTGQPNSPLARAERVEWFIFDMEGLDRAPNELIDHYRKGRAGRLPNFPLRSSTAISHDEYMTTMDSCSTARHDLGVTK
jgi:hypothetical protein